MSRAPSPQRSLGYSLVNWYETFLVHGPGDVQGQPIELDWELTEFTVNAYAVDDAGRRCYDEVFLSRPKGRAKSELGGMFGSGEALAPVRFDHWAAEGEASFWGYKYEPGEPVGRPVTYPFIRCLATEEDQSDNTYGNVAFMLAHVAEHHGDVYPGIDIGRDWQTSTRIYLPGGGEIVPSTASSAAKDGGKESFCVFDEPHLYNRPELIRMYRTVKRNLVKRRAAESWGLLTSTMYAKGEGSIAEQLHELAAKGTHPRLLLDHRGTRRHIESLDDLDAVVAELRYVYGPFADVMDLERILGALRDPIDDEADRRRYWLNEETDNTSKFLPSGAWPACTDISIVVADGTAITLGFDGSLRQDATALRGCTREGHLFYLTKPDGSPAVWERPERLPPGEDWEVPSEEVDEAIALAFDRFVVVRGYFDPAWYGGWIATWAGRYGDRRVTAWWTNRDAPMARALREIRTAIMQRELTNDGHPTAARHWANAHKQECNAKDEQGERMFLIRKDRKGSPRKIDTAMADTLAWQARNDALAADEFIDDYDVMQSAY